MKNLLENMKILQVNFIVIYIIQKKIVLFKIIIIVKRF